MNNPDTITKTVSQPDTFRVIQSAVNKAVNIVKPTFGPASNKVIIDNQLYRMTVDDGVQIARDLRLEDPMENAVLNVIREAAVRTNDRVGDGTTGSLIILQAIINEVAQKSRFEGHKVVKELQEGLKAVKKHLEKNAVPIKKKEDIRKVALVSFDNEEIAEKIAEMYMKVGKEGTVTVDKSPTMETTVETTKGIKLNSGYISPYMVNSPQRMETELEKPYILITDYRLTENTDIIPIMDKMARAGANNLVVIAQNVEQTALATLVINLPRVASPQFPNGGKLQSVAVAAPKTLQTTAVLLNDIAIMTGAKFFSVEKGDKLENATLEDLGRAAKFICRRDESIIIKPEGSTKEAAFQLRAALEVAKDDDEKKQLEERLARFTNSLAVIKVGAPTENEQKALKYKVEDAVHAVKSALQHGVVCGAGRALLEIKTGSPTLDEALASPARQIAENMGLDEENLKAGEARNVITGKAGPFLDVGVADPVDVLIAQVESAVSIASILLTSNGMIVEYAKDKK